MKYILILLLCFSISSPMFSQKDRVVPFPDKSLTTDEYIERGMPSPEREWATTDYLTAVEVLKKLNAEDKLLLPRENSEKSGEMFARMTSRENFAFLKDSINFQQKAMRLQGFDALQPMIFLYMDKGNAQQGFSKDLMSCMIFMVDVAKDIYVFGDELLKNPDLPKNNPRFQEGIKGMKNGLITMINGSLSTIELHPKGEKSYNDSDVIRFSDSFSRALPIMWNGMEKSVQKEYLLRIKKLSDKYPIREIKSDMKDLYTTLKSM